MTTQEIDDYLYYEFNVSDPSELSSHDRIIAYERLKFKLLDKELTPSQYTSAIINLAEHLEV